ncbi:uroporphyrinogen decarboxylase family protein [Limosilactobacillus sp.]|uniref:uroporphyrinogen decarboxylase family protein n=1 Tax=Limosilactobacillus sp. TaxID=2773925 RepID=UPI00345EA3CA
MSLPRETVLKVLRGQGNGVVPASFWRHFADNEFTNAFEDPSVIKINLDGHRDYLAQVDVDFVKTMLDGYFPYPFRGVDDPNDPHSLAKIQPLADDDPWISQQVDLARQQKQLVGDKPIFVTMFSPMYLFKWALIQHYVDPLLLADHRFADLYEKDPELVKHVLDVIAHDLGKVAKAVMQTGIDGIYYSTQSVQDDRLNNSHFFTQVMEPTDQLVQEAINAVSPLNILHICGFDGAYNHLDWFTDYPLQVINWATKTDGYSLAKGQKLFGGRPVLGGLDNSTKGVLYRGNEEEIKDAVHRLIDEAGSHGVIIGADCTVPRDINYDHLRWAIEAAHESN